MCSSDGRIKCLDTFSGYECGCGKCYREGRNARGQIACQPKCDLKKCDASTGMCAAGGVSGDSSPPEAAADADLWSGISP